MAMTDQEHKALRAYCAFLLKEYGFQLSPTDPIIPALYIIHKEMQLNNQNNKALASSVKDASTKMNSKVFHFNTPGEAWKFQLGIALKWISFSALFLVLVWAAIWSWVAANDLDHARVIIHSSEKIPALVKRVGKDKEGYYFIDFTEAQGSSIKSFVEYEKLSSKTIRIYLGKEPE